MPEQSGIYFKDEGSGFPVLLIHGFCETHEIWNSFSEKLSDQYRVLSVDLPGFGKSPFLDTPFSIKDVATKVLEWVRSIEIKECVIIGHSLGGYVMLAMIEQQPQLFKGACLFHSTAYADSDEKKISRNKVIEFVSNHGVRPFIESFIPPLFYSQTNPAIAGVVKLALSTKIETLISYVGAMRDRPERTEVLRKFKEAIMFIAGEKDGVVSPESLKKQSLLALNPVLFVLPEVAHMGMFESEQVVLSKIRSFLQAVSL
jgi:pimeloyl-ACP methyl ester carboxylesterase